MLKKIVFFIIYASGLVYYIELVRRRVFRENIRLLYAHRIISRDNELYPFLKRLGYLTVEDLNRRLRYMLKRYQFISIGDYVECFRNLKKPSANHLVLTIDDGYSCSYDTIFPLLRRYRIPAVIFITTGNIGTNAVLTQDFLLKAIGTSTVKEFSLPELSPLTYSLRNWRDRTETFKDISSRLKKIGNDEKDRILSKLSELLKVDPGKPYKGSRMLKWTEVREMRDSGLVSFGTHTISHPILTKIPLAEARREIMMSKEVLERELNEKVRFIAYPNGQEDDFDVTTINLVRESGYDMAFTTIESCRKGFGCYEVPRYGLVGEPFYMFALRMSGFFDLVHLLKERYRKRKSPGSSERRPVAVERGTSG
jgi:peptidoglycan/xylan/chitin deacetylase (PgdA/CDA1 family)